MFLNPLSSFSFFILCGRAWEFFWLDRNTEPLTGYSFWDRFRNFLHKFTWIVLSVHKFINWVNSGKFMGNCWISCQVMPDMENFYDDLIIINLYEKLDRGKWMQLNWLYHTNILHTFSGLVSFILSFFTAIIVIALKQEPIN